MSAISQKGEGLQDREWQMKAGTGKKESMKGHFSAVISLDSQRFSHPSQNYTRLNQCVPYSTPLSPSIPPPKMRELRAHFQGLQFLCYVPGNFST